MTHGSLFSEPVWTLLLKNIIIGLTRNAVDAFIELRSEFVTVGISGNPNFLTTGNFGSNKDGINQKRGFEMGLPTPTFHISGFETSKKKGGTIS